MEGGCFGRLRLTSKSVREIHRNKKIKKITEFNKSICLTIMAGSVVNTVNEKFLKLEWHKNEQ